MTPALRMDTPVEAAQTRKREDRPGGGKPHGVVNLQTALPSWAVSSDPSSLRTGKAHLFQAIENKSFDWKFRKCYALYLTHSSPVGISRQQPGISPQTHFRGRQTIR